MDRKRIGVFGLLMVVIIFGMIFSGCTQNTSNVVAKLNQTGSSTLLPLAIIWAEEFDGAEISVSGGGSSHGLKCITERRIRLR